jgi:16S rRNA (uracil1498-N3)-methyltransferase
MRSHRFSINKNDKVSKESLLIRSPDLIHQISNVLRLAKDTELSFIDGSGMVFYGEISEANKSELNIKIIKTENSARELDTQIHFLLPIIKQENFSWMIRKLCEIGVQEFTPIIFDRSQKNNVQAINKESFRTRIEKIIQEATEQCEGAVFAKYNNPIKFDGIAKLDLSNSAKIFASERLADENSKKVCHPEEWTKSNTSGSKHFLLVGPEGGLSDKEDEQLINLGFNPKLLGKRLLKAETAAIVLSSFYINLP